MGDTHPNDLSGEFPVRYRLPRTISRAYESVCFAVEPDEVLGGLRGARGGGCDRSRLVGAVGA